MSDHSERKSVNSRRSFIVGMSNASVAAAAPTETPFANGHAFFLQRRLSPATPNEKSSSTHQSEVEKEKCDVRRPPKP